MEKNNLTEKDRKKTYMYGYVMTAMGAFTMVVSMFVDDSSQMTIFAVGLVFLLIGLATAASSKKKA